MPNRLTGKLKDWARRMAVHTKCILYAEYSETIDYLLGKTDARPESLELLLVGPEDERAIVIDAQENAGYKPELVANGRVRMVLPEIGDVVVRPADNVAIELMAGIEDDDLLDIARAAILKWEPVEEEDETPTAAAPPPKPFKTWNVRFYGNVGSNYWAQIVSDTEPTTDKALAALKATPDALPVPGTLCDSIFVWDASLPTSSALLSRKVPATQCRIESPASPSASYAFIPDVWLDDEAIVKKCVERMAAAKAGHALKVERGPGRTPLSWTVGCVEWAFESGLKAQLPPDATDDLLRAKFKELRPQWPYNTFRAQPQGGPAKYVKTK